MAQGTGVLFPLNDERETNINTLSCLLGINEPENILALSLEFMKQKLVDCQLHDEYLNNILEGDSAPVKREDAFTKLNRIRHNVVAIRNILSDLESEKREKIQGLLNDILVDTVKIQSFVNVFSAETRQEGNF